MSQGILNHLSRLYRVFVPHSSTDASRKSFRQKDSLKFFCVLLKLGFFRGFHAPRSFLAVENTVDNLLEIRWGSGCHLLPSGAEALAEPAVRSYRVILSWSLRTVFVENRVQSDQPPPEIQARARGESTLTHPEWPRWREVEESCPEVNWRWKWD